MAQAPVAAAAPPVTKTLSGSLAVVLIATPGSYRANAYARAARSNALLPFVVTEGTAAAVPPDTIGIAADLADPQDIVNAISRHVTPDRLTAVIGVDDGTVEVAAVVAGHLGLPANDPEAARATRDKVRSRSLLKRYPDIDVPEFYVVPSGSDLSAVAVPFEPPWVVKPSTLSASRGVIRVDSSHELEATLRQTRAIADRSGEAEAALLIEQFVPGDEIAIEAVITPEGGLQVLAVFDKPEPLNGPYFEETYYVTPTRFGGRLDEITDALVKACAALGLVTGPVHAEMRVSDKRLWILEVAGRTIGGDCGGLFELAVGTDIESLVLALASGREAQAAELHGAAGVLMIPVPGHGILRRVEGLGEARSVEGVLDVRIDIRDGYELTPWPEGGAYPGFIFAKAATPARVEQALREAHDCLNFVLAPVLPVSLG